MYFLERRDWKNNGYAYLITYKDLPVKELAVEYYLQTKLLCRPL